MVAATEWQWLVAAVSVSSQQQVCLVAAYLLQQRYCSTAAAAFSTACLLARGWLSACCGCEAFTAVQKGWGWG